MSNSSPHFFKAYSRIGLTSKPIRQTQWNIGVEEGPEQILTPQFLNNFPNSEISEFKFTNPEDVKKDNYWTTLASELKRFKELINSALKENQKQIVIGGDNTITFSSLLALLERVGDIKKIGYIQFDSHGEMNSVQNSPSGNFHGMYMRPFLDNFDNELIDKLVPQKFSPTQILTIGDQALDGDEPQFYKDNSIQNINFLGYKQDQLATQIKVADFISQYEYIHINFDIDIFDASVAGATGIPNDGKWQLDHVMILLNLIARHPNLSFDLSEVNPKKPNSDKTIKVAQIVLKTVLNY